MYTITDIITDITRGCMAHNMVENKFSYRIVFFINDGGKGSKYYIDTLYSDLRKSLERIIRNNLSMTNSVVISETTAWKNGKCICLQSKPYSFSLDEYFKRINGEYKDRNKNEYTVYGRYAAAKMGGIGY